ncbi:hypothetical protein PHLH6_51610 [Pseudomonas sp. Seg1]|nr:hypothetical protein PHLH6_51610 [Pseudomonas sp. Seg1]
MPRAVLALLLLVALPVWAAAPKDLTWSEMIPRTPRRKCRT